MKALSGKTYFTAGSGFDGSALFSGEVDLQTTISAVFAAAMAIFLRKGITSEAVKAAAPAEEKPESNVWLKSILAILGSLFKVIDKNFVVRGKSR